MLLTACIHALFSWSSWDVALFTAQGCRAFFKYFFFQNLFPLPIYDLNSTVNQGDFFKKIFFSTFCFCNLVAEASFNGSHILVFNLQPRRTQGSFIKDGDGIISWKAALGQAGQTELCSWLHLQEIAVDKIELNMCSSDSGSPGSSSYQADMCFDKPQLCPLSRSSRSCCLPPASSPSRAELPSPDTAPAPCLQLDPSGGLCQSRQNST